MCLKTRLSVSGIVINAFGVYVLLVHAGIWQQLYSSELPEWHRKFDFLLTGKSWLPAPLYGIWLLFLGVLLQAVTAFL